MKSFGVSQKLGWYTVFRPFIELYHKGSSVTSPYLLTNTNIIYDQLIYKLDVQSYFETITYKLEGNNFIKSSPDDFSCCKAKEGDDAGASLYDNNAVSGKSNKKII